MRTSANIGPQEVAAIRCEKNRPNFPKQQNVNYFGHWDNHGFVLPAFVQYVGTLPLHPGDITRVVKLDFLDHPHGDSPDANLPIFDINNTSICDARHHLLVLPTRGIFYWRRWA
jgi:hypothetical protein